MQVYKFNTQTLEYEITKQRKYIHYFIVAAIFIILGFGSGVKINTLVERIPIVLISKPEPCNPENIKAFIKKTNLKFPKIVYQQIMVESQNLKSPIFLQLNNLMGMENARSRPTTGKDTGVRFAQYENWKQSIVDYALWQASYAKEIQNEDDYYYLLDRLYCSKDLPENSGQLYSTRLKQIKYE